MPGYKVQVLNCDEWVTIGEHHDKKSALMHAKYTHSMDLLTNVRVVVREDVWYSPEPEHIIVVDKDSVARGDEEITRKWGGP